MNKIKTVFILTVALFATTFLTSCSSDDDDNTNTSSIVGTWLVTAETSETFIDGESQGIEDEVVDADNYSKITFNTDGTFSLTYSESYNGQIETDTETGTYTKDGNTLSITYDGDPDVYESTIELTANQLKYSDSEEYSISGIDYKYTYSATYSRQ